MARHYLLVSLKVLARRPFFTFVSLFGICLTLVVLTLGAAFFENIFGATGPEVHMDRMLGVFYVEMTNDEGSHYFGEAGYSLFDRHLRDLELAEELSLVTVPSPAVSFVDGRKVPLDMRWVDGAFFRMMRFEFLEGGPITDQDDAEARPVAVISRQTRERLFGDGPALGESFEVDGQRLQVRGVVENVPNFRPISAADVWVPIHAARSDNFKFGWQGRFQALLLARHAEDLSPLREEVTARLGAVDPAEDGGGYTTFLAHVETPFDALSAQILEAIGNEELTGDRDAGGPGPGARLRLLLLAGALVFMALPSLNLINLNLSRILERSTEIGVRKSFGASSRTLIFQFLVENLVLTLLGGVLGFVLAALGLEAISGTRLVAYAELEMNLRIFAWGLALAALFAFVSGVYPAWRMSKLHPKQALEENPS